MNKCSKVIPAVAQVMILVVPIALSAQELIDIIFIKAAYQRILKNMDVTEYIEILALGESSPTPAAPFSLPE